MKNISFFTILSLTLSTFAFAEHGVRISTENDTLIGEGVEDNNTPDGGDFFSIAYKGKRTYFFADADIGLYPDGKKFIQPQVNTTIAEFVPTRNGYSYSKVSCQDTAKKYIESLISFRYQVTHQLQTSDYRTGEIEEFEYISLVERTSTEMPAIARQVSKIKIRSAMADESNGYSCADSDTDFGRARCGKLDIRIKRNSVAIPVSKNKNKSFYGYIFNKRECNNKKRYQNPATCLLIKRLNACGLQSLHQGKRSLTAFLEEGASEIIERGERRSRSSGEVHYGDEAPAGDYPGSDVR